MLCGRTVHTRSAALPPHLAIRTGHGAAADHLPRLGSGSGCFAGWALHRHTHANPRPSVQPPQQDMYTPYTRCPARSDHTPLPSGCSSSCLSAASTGAASAVRMAVIRSVACSRVWNYTRHHRYCWAQVWRRSYQGRGGEHACISRDQQQRPAGDTQPRRSAGRAWAWLRARPRMRPLTRKPDARASTPAPPTATAALGGSAIRRGQGNRRAPQPSAVWGV